LQEGQQARPRVSRIFEESFHTRCQREANTPDLQGPCTALSTASSLECKALETKEKVNQRESGYPIFRFVELIDYELDIGVEVGKECSRHAIAGQQ
jgi:hypothetical protein